MNLLASVLPYLQIVLSVVLVTAILLQRSGADIGGALGSGDGSSFHSTRRGFEKFLFVLTIVCAVLFALTALGTILIKAQI